MKYPNLSRAIQKLLPEACFVLSGHEEKESYEKIKWIVGQDHTKQNLFGKPDFEIPSWEEVEKVWDELKVEYAIFEYQRKRKPEYPSLEECIHAILDDNLEELQAKRLAVKEKYPKPELKDGN
jgi:hypothetical protein